jgi:hypothetical protein
MYKNMGVGAIDDDYYNVFDMDVEYPALMNPNGLIIYNPKLMNDRLKAQEGLFSIPRSINYYESRDEIIQKTDSIEFTADLREDIVDETLEGV